MYQLERSVKLLLSFKDAWNVRETNKAVLEFIDDAIEVEIPAYKGAKGDQGDPGAPPVYEWEVPTTADLPSTSDLTDNEIGHFWTVVGSSSAWFWNGAALIEKKNYIGEKGDPGVTPTLSIGTVTGGPAASASFTPGAADNYHLNLVLPKGDPGEKGEKGDKGPSSGILTAVDFVAAAGAAPGDALVLSPTTGKVTSAPVARGGWYGIPPSSFTAANVLVGSSTTRVQLAQITIPAQPTDWFPRVSGHIRTRGGKSTRIDVEVRLGDPTSGTLIGYGSGIVTENYFPVTITPELASAMAPNASVARVTKNTSGPGSTIYVVAVKSEGFWDAWLTDTAHAHLDVECRPAV
ncbi:hypothetical protein [Rhodococcus sp. NPDC127528]|uniref:hypothetical protein n=1 Tax=unclassified Rhodococcus (in: high G+C Gram-positive bacteria) TaxID=192944 RepID=UPI0036395509